MAFTKQHMSQNKNKSIIIMGHPNDLDLVIETFESESSFTSIGLVVASVTDVQDVSSQHKIMGTLDELPLLMKKFNINSGILAAKDNKLRQKLYKKVSKLAPQFKFTSFVHPKAVLGKGVRIGNGCMIMSGAILNSDSRTEDFCYIKSRASLGHDSHVKSFSVIDVNATLAGNVSIGTGCYVGLGANIIQDITIGNYCKIHDNTLVNKNIKDGSIVNGIPAKVIGSFFDEE